MKKILLILLFLSTAPLAHGAHTWPAPVGHVNDFAGIIPQDKKQALESFLVELEQKTGSQVAVVTVDSVEGPDINRAAVELFQAWGIGQRGKDNGVLILASFKDHMARIEVGYGLEGVITDGTAGDILRQQMMPQFKLGNYGKGFTDGAVKIAELIASHAGVDLESKVSSGQEAPAQDSWDPRILIFIIFIIYIIFRILWAIYGPRRHSIWGNDYSSGGWSGGGFGSSGGGGFGGFGGGSSGGGGASGSW